MVGRKGAPRCRFLSGGNEAADKSIVPEYREESDDSGEDKIRLSSSTQSEINLKQYRKITLSCAVYGNTHSFFYKRQWKNSTSFATKKIRIFN